MAKHREILYSIDRVRRLLFYPGDIVVRPGLQAQGPHFVAQAFDRHLKRYRTVGKHTSLAATLSMLGLKFELPFVEIHRDTVPPQS